MPVTRETAHLPAYSYCREPGCMWMDSAAGDLPAEAQAHADEAGHEVRCVQVTETIIRPAPAVTT